MTGEEAIFRVKTGKFNNNFGFDMQILIDVVGTLGEMFRSGQVIESVRCKDCKNWIAGYITDQDEFIPPKCGKYQQMVGHSSDDFCSLAERQ